MTVDIVVAFLFGVLAYLGWRSGALSQALRIVAALAVIFGAPFGAIVVREAVFHETTLSEPVVEMVSLFLAGFGIYVGIAVAAWLAVRAMRATSRTLSTMDRFGGLLVGAVKGVLLVYFVVTGFLLLQVPLERVDPDDRLGVRGGHVTSFVEQHNVIAPWQFPDLARMHDLLAVGYWARERDGHRALREAGRAADVLRRAPIEVLLGDAELMEAVLADRYPQTLADPRVRELLDDAEFVADLRAVGWATLRVELAPAAPSLLADGGADDGADDGADEPAPEI